MSAIARIKHAWDCFLQFSLALFFRSLSSPSLFRCFQFLSSLSQKTCFQLWFISTAICVRAALKMHKIAFACWSLFRISFPLLFNPRTRSVHFNNFWDYFKNKRCWIVLTLICLCHHLFLTPIRYLNYFSVTLSSHFLLTRLLVSLNGLPPQVVIHPISSTYSIIALFLRHFILQFSRLSRLLVSSIFDKMVCHPSCCRSIPSHLIHL